MLNQKETLALHDIQKYVTELEKEKGFIDQTIKDKCLLLGEEIGELFKAVRKKEGLLIDSESTFNNIGHELVDIMIYLCAIANRCQIDLERSFREKMQLNKNRKWHKA